MHWLRSPKVRLGLIVNALYFVSLFTPAQPHRRPRFYERLAERRTESAAAAHTLPAYAPLPPPAGPSKAETNYSSGQLNIYLSNDLTLVKRPGHTLLLSPLMTARPGEPVAPNSILLRFVSFSSAVYYDDDTPMVITADGTEMWRYGSTGEVDDMPSHARVPHSVTYDGGSVNETIGHELPYDVFVEIISARRVIVELGPDRVELTADQIEALRDMHRKLPLPSPPDETGQPTVIIQGEGGGAAPHNHGSDYMLPPKPRRTR